MKFFLVNKSETEEAIISTVI